MNSDLMLMTAKFTPENVILEQLEEALKEHKLAPTDKTKTKLLCMCMLLMSKDVINTHGMEKSINDCQQVNSIMGRLNTSN